MELEPDKMPNSGTPANRSSVSSAGGSGRH
jgi:hypothetical protein